MVVPKGQIPAALIVYSRSIFGVGAAEKSPWFVKTSFYLATGGKSGKILLKRFSKRKVMILMPVTIRDIARKLDLSIGAVSRAMDGYPDISEETRERVIQTAKEMGYVPNRAARQLRRKKADAIGYVLPSQTPRFADPFFTEFVAGLGDETARHPFDLTISIAPPGEYAEKRLYQSWVQGHKVDGFILTHLRLNDWRVGYLSDQDFPFSVLESLPDPRNFPRIDVDRQGATMSLVTHLVERGFHQIAFIGGPSELQIQASQYNGYRQGLEAGGIPFNTDLVTTSDLTSSGGHLATKRLLSIPDPPDAIMCINDETALGALHALRDLGVTIGTDVAVTGFDGVALSAHSDPPLTTLDIPVYEIACKLVELLAAELEHQSLSERRIVFTPRLLKRASTGDSSF
jgi:LacI family transcriptional regulator